MSTSIMLLPIIFAVVAIVIVVVVVVIVLMSRKKHSAYSGLTPEQQMQMPVQPTSQPQNSPAFCPQCGSGLQPDSIFCNNCGCRVQ